MAQVSFSTRMDPGLYNWLQAYSKEVGVPQAQLIAAALRRLKADIEAQGGLEDEEEGNSNDE